MYVPTLSLFRRRQSSQHVVHRAALDGHFRKLVRVSLLIGELLLKHVGLVFGVDIREPVEAPRRKCERGCVRVSNRKSENAVRFDYFRCVKVGIFHESHVTLETPFGKDVRAVGDKTTGSRPLVFLLEATGFGIKTGPLTPVETWKLDPDPTSLLISRIRCDRFRPSLYRWAVDGRRGGETDEIEEIGRRLTEANFEGVVIERPDSDGSFKMRLSQIPQLRGASCRRLLGEFGKLLVSPRPEFRRPVDDEEQV